VRASDKTICEKVDFWAFFVALSIEERKKLIRDNGISSLLMFIVCLSTFQSLNNHRNSTNEKNIQRGTEFQPISQKNSPVEVWKCVEFPPKNASACIFEAFFPRFVRFLVFVDAGRELINILNFPFIQKYTHEKAKERSARFIMNCWLPLTTFYISSRCFLFLLLLAR
jgi:hypothetical protein